MAYKSISVIKENKNGYNTHFRDNKAGLEMTRAQLVKEIENRSYPNHHIRKISGIKTPVYNPDNKNGNNID